MCGGCWRVLSSADPLCTVDKLEQMFYTGYVFGPQGTQTQLDPLDAPLEGFFLFNVSERL